MRQTEGEEEDADAEEEHAEEEDNDAENENADAEEEDVGAAEVRGVELRRRLQGSKSCGGGKVCTGRRRAKKRNVVALTFEKTNLEKYFQVRDGNAFPKKISRKRIKRSAFLLRV
ncbi:hypothetical protein QML37_31625 [Klebsiella pneumoniae]|uniref:hypothetical protein n=1 Tax=Klebsiella pneumoniae TaxID=573 RepID=UPI003A811597